MEIKALKEIGLTEGESKVYLTLIKIGLSKTGLISKEAGISSSKVYKVLDRLEKKGLVGSVMKGKVKHFRTLEPKRILSYIKEKEDELKEKKKFIEEILPSLEKERNQALKSPEAAVYFGVKGVMNVYNSLLDELKSGEDYHVIGAGYGFKEISGLREFFHIYHKRRAEKKILVKMLANHDVRNMLVPTTRLNSEIRFLPSYLITDMIILIYHNKVAILILTKEPVVFQLESEEARVSFIKYFNAFWKIAKP